MPGESRKTKPLMGFEELTFPNDERIPSEYRGKHRVVKYGIRCSDSGIQESYVMVSEKPLEGDALKWALSQINAGADYQEQPGKEDTVSYPDTCFSYFHGSLFTSPFIRGQGSGRYVVLIVEPKDLRD
ncbi:MAG: hypothetical protein HY514_00065 [Candidatus Aenigmarchaeota archaeon]|nr:hypothetical protein [Candidatus Aenigmarchaeota archaeon]